MKRAIVEIANRLKDSAGMTDDAKKFDGSKKYGKNGILYAKKYCRKIIKT